MSLKVMIENGLKSRIFPNLFSPSILASYLYDCVPAGFTAGFMHLTIYTRATLLHPSCTMQTASPSYVNRQLPTSQPTTQDASFLHYQIVVKETKRTPLQKEDSVERVPFCPNPNHPIFYALNTTKGKTPGCEN